MRIRVLAFARMRELLGDAQDVELTGDVRIDDVRVRLADGREAVRLLMQSTRVARNGRIVHDMNEHLADGDELALLPPVGGG